MSDRHDHGDHGDHGHDDHGHEGHHHHDETDSLDVAVLTITTSRDPDSDESGAVARAALESAGHDVTEYDTVPDDADAVRERVRGVEADAVVTTGGTGLTDDDVTVEAVRPLFEREMPGFGEYFRRLSHEQVGTPAMLSRATAGVTDDAAVYALPGNPDAVELGVTECVVPELGHVVSLIRRD